MDRELLERRLAAAERNVALGFAVIAEQRQAVAALNAWGQDATIARRILQAFEEMQAVSSKIGNRPPSNSPPTI